jgi:ribonuclease P/MRP protein subunit RPP1
MDLECFVPFESEDDNPHEVLRITVERLVRLGWGGIVLTRTISSAKSIPPAPSPISLSNLSQSIIARNYGLFVLNDYPPFPQFSRLNLLTDDVQQLHLLARQLPNLRYDLVSVTPLSDEVFKNLCSSADIDIISIDSSKYVPKKCWKDLKSAVNRDVAIEFYYSRFIGNDFGLKNLIWTVQSVLHATKGRGAKNRKIFVSLGSDQFDMVRSPADVRNIGRLLGIPGAQSMTRECVKNIIGRGLARRCHCGVVRRIPDKVAEDLDELFCMKIDE